MKKPKKPGDLLKKVKKIHKKSWRGNPNPQTRNIGQDHLQGNTTKNTMEIAHARIGNRGSILQGGASNIASVPGVASAKMYKKKPKAKKSKKKRI